jgi:hypothetical protein
VAVQAIVAVAPPQGIFAPPAMHHVVLIQTPK